MTAEFDKLADYEGLVLATTRRFAPIIADMDFDDIAQVLRVKVWQALAVYDRRRSALPRKNYVNQCLQNQVKDLLKQQSRLNERRNGRQLYIEDQAGEGDWFEDHYLAMSEEEALAAVEDERVVLPSTLTELERAVVALLLLDFSQAEIARRLGIGRQHIGAARNAIQEKMADWRPGSASWPARVAIAA